MCIMIACWKWAYLNDSVLEVGLSENRLTANPLMASEISRFRFFKGNRKSTRTDNGICDCLREHYMFVKKLYNYRIHINMHTNKPGLVIDKQFMEVGATLCPVFKVINLA